MREGLGGLGVMLEYGIWRHLCEVLEGFFPKETMPQLFSLENFHILLMLHQHIIVNCDCHHAICVQGSLQHYLRLIGRSLFPRRLLSPTDHEDREVVIQVAREESADL